MAKLGNRQYKTLTCTVCKSYSYRTDKNVKNIQLLKKKNNK